MPAVSLLATEAQCRLMTEQVLPMKPPRPTERKHKGLYTDCSSAHFTPPPRQSIDIVDYLSENLAFSIVHQTRS